MRTKIFCFFCGRKLQEATDGSHRWNCLGCQAVFRAERDPQGCVVELKVGHCGTEDCCRLKNSKRRSCPE